MKRIFAAIVAAAITLTGAAAWAQATTVTSQVTVPASIQCSASFDSTISLTGFDVQNPGVADIVFVLDESGSIAPANFTLMKQFVTDMINGLMTGPGGARVGIAMFSSDARTVLPMTNIKASALNATAGILQRGGATCIGCGIDQGRVIFNAAAPRPEATQFMIVLTDGQNTVNTATFPTVVSNAKAAGIKMLAIGVGSSVLASQITFISSSIPGVQTAFFTADFDELSTIVNTLTAAIVSPGATNLTVEVEVLPRFPLQNATATSGAVLAAGSHVTWTLPSLGASTETLTIAHHHDGTGNGPLQVLSATYADAEGHVVTIDEPFTNVTGCNVAPVANAGNDQTIPLTGSPTAAATLDGSGSTDDGLIQPLSYNWSSNTGITASGATPSVTLPFGTHAFTLTVGDGEFTDTDTVVIDVIDPTAPVIGSTITGTPGLNGWYTSNVAVAWTTADPETGIASSIGCDPAAVLADTMGQTISCTATNGAGASSTQSVVVMRDATAPALTTSGPVSAGATSAAGATVTYAAPSASDATSGLAGPAVCAPASGSLFPLGPTDVTCLASDRAGNQASAHFTVTVSDTTPPVINPVVPSRSSLWPPNHKMVAISLVASATDAVSAATCAIGHVSSSEPDNGLGDGDTVNDMVITGPLSVELRAERRGGGPGRVYTIQVTCTDTAGNAASSSTTVTVPASNAK